MASSRSEEFVIPRGYVKQELSDVTTKYIKGEVLQKWLDKRKHIFGSRCAFIVSEPQLHFDTADAGQQTDRSSDQHVLTMKRKLTDVSQDPRSPRDKSLIDPHSQDELDELEDLSYPKDKKNVFI
jgi:hypothetical protein